MASDHKKEIGLEVQETNTKARVFSHVSASVLALVFCLVLMQFPLHNLSNLLLDGLYRLQITNPPRAPISLVTYDDTSTLKYSGMKRLPPEELVQIFDALAEEKPKAVLLIGALDDYHYTPIELQQIAKSFRKVPRPMVGYTEDSLLGAAVPTVIDFAPFLPGFISRDNISFGADSVSRRVMLSVEGITSVYAAMACETLGQPAQCKLDIPIQYLGNSSYAYIDWNRPPAFPIYSSADVGVRAFPKSSFRDRIVLVGTALTSRLDTDYVLTPFSRDLGKTSALEAAAQSLNSLLNKDALRPSSNFVNWALCIFCALLTVNIVLLLSPGPGITFIGISLLILGIVSAILLHGFSYWLAMAHPLIVTIVAYYLVIPYRLAEEYRTRWHYQEKSELMAELETLKSNFLSLVSHDLKTPVARIQGNTELLLNSAENLTSRQNDSLTAILKTTEYLGQYVETVLDLTRIESAKTPVQKSTKDINATIKEVVESKRFIAAEKNIKIKTDLEPIFSIRYDVKLMRRVLGNLVENAIRYSPPDTDIVLRSQENGPWVRVSVQDQGIGIPADEQEKIFSKFYRGSRAAAHEPKGTGLGLYLVKYFVELHEGIVELKSEVGRGSTFTVSLPV